MQCLAAYAKLTTWQIFALIIGYPPFDSFLFEEKELVSQWIGTFGELPSEWQGYSTLQDIGRSQSQDM